MYPEFHTSSISKFTFTPSNFLPSAYYTKSFSNTRVSFGFSNSSKRVPKSLTGLRNHGGLIGVRCRCQGGVVVQGNDKMDDAFYMRRGLELARKAVGYTSPNPMVGCVIVKDGKVVGEGFHPKAGEPHAEVFALRDAGDLAENGTAYVTLEPCNHYGRTPPCTEALIKAKVKKVVIGMVDPNPIVASKGVERLREAGIDVTTGVEEAMCQKINEAYIHQMLTGKPFVTLRYTISIDGSIINEVGKEAMQCGGYYSKLLEEYDAVILSSTFVQNSSFLLSNEPRANQPLQIVIAKNPTSPIHVPVIPSELTSKVIIFTDRETDVRRETAQEGIETIVLDKLSLTTILKYCKDRGLCSVLMDLSGNLDDFTEIVTEGFEQNLVQKFVSEVLPISGGSREDALTMTIASLIREKKKSLVKNTSSSLMNLTSKIPGNSILLEGYF